MAEEQESERDDIEEDRFDQKSNPFHVLSISLEAIQKLSKPSLISAKLLAFNIIIFCLTISIVVSHLWIGGDEFVSLTGLGIALISLFASCLFSIPYTVFMEIMTNTQIDRIGSLRIGSAILLVGLSLASAGLFFNKIVLTVSAIIIIGIQVIPFLLGMFISLGRGRVADREVPIGAFGEVFGWFTGVAALIGLLIIIFFMMSVVLNN